MQGLTTAPVLRTFDSGRRSVVTTDANEVTISAVLTQPDDDGHYHPASYQSRKLTAAEQAYPPHVLELLAVVHSLPVFRHKLLGSGTPSLPGVLSGFTFRKFTRRSRGCARSGTSTAFSRAGSTRSRSSASAASSASSMSLAGLTLQIP